MNSFQQLAILGVTSEEVDTIEFDRVEDFLRWKQEEGFE